MADVYVYMAINKLLNLVDFNHLQTVSEIKAFSSIASIYYENKIKNVTTPKFWP